MDTETTSQNTATPATANAPAAFAPTQLADAFAAATSPIETDSATNEQGQQGATDDKAAAEAAAQAHATSVHNGRLGAAMRENNSLKKSLSEKDEEIARLREQLEASRKTLPPKERYKDVEGIDNFDDDTVKLVDAIAEKREAAIRQQLEEQRKRNEELERRFAMSGAKSSEDEVKAAVWREVEARTPGLLARVSGGGDLVDAWTAFTHNEKDPATGLPWGTALGEALKRGYAPGITRVFEQFVERNGLARQHDGTGLAPTPPASKGAGGEGGLRDSNGRKVWPSKQAIFDEMERVSAAERRGSITSAERHKQLEALEDDFRSGRYVK